MDTKTIGMMVREARHRKGITMKELGARFGLSECCVHHYEKGERDMGVVMFLKFCKFLDIDPSCFMDQID